jgi:hypothetical protein
MWVEGTDFRSDGPAPNVGHVGTLDHYRTLLREITEMAFREG